MVSIKMSFFYSMLKRQIALDNSSFERLKWHLNKVKSLKLLNPKPSPQKGWVFL